LNLKKEKMKKVIHAQGFVSDRFSPSSLIPSYRGVLITFAVLRRPSDPAPFELADRRTRDGD
jgi:hypothetical protein